MNTEMETGKKPAAHRQWITTLLLLVMIVTIYLQYQWNQAIDWGKPNITLPVYRGEDGNVRPLHFAEADLKAYAGTLQDAIVSSMPKRTFRLTFGPRTEFSVATELRELFDGTLSVEVTALHYRDRTPAKTWKREFATADEFTSSAQAFGAEIAGDIAAMMQP